MLEIEKFSKIIAANWKMNGSITFIDNFLNQLDLINNHNKFICTIICPPFVYSQYVSNKINNFYLGGQDCSLFQTGSYTGDISASMLNDIGCQFCIVGHSEKREKFYETDDQVAIKASNSLKSNIHPIVCVGETLAQKKDNQTKEVLSKQIRKSIPKNSNNKNTIIAYEPIWAIGTGLTPSIDEIKDIHNFIKKEIRDYENFQILYGGSVKSTNSNEILNIDSVDGVLVGGASLDIKEFNKILSF